MRELRPGEKPKTLASDVEERLSKEQRAYLESLQYDGGLPVAELPYDDDPRLREKIAKRNDAIDRIESIANPIPDFVGEPVLIRFPVGQPAQEIDAMGHVREADWSMTAEEAAEHAKREERFYSEVADLSADWRQVNDLRKTTAELSDPTVAAVYRERANALAEQTADRRDFLREERVKHYEALGLSHADALDMLAVDGLGPRLGEHRPATDQAVVDAVEAVKSGSFGAEQVAALDPKQRYQLMQELGEVDSKLADAITDSLEHEYERAE